MWKKDPYRYWWAAAEGLVLFFGVTVGSALWAFVALWWVLPLALTNNPLWCIGAIWTGVVIGVTGGLLAEFVNP